MYLSGHPMDDYRKFLKGKHVVPIGELMSGEEGESQYKDNQIVSIAGLIEKVKNKTTRNNSMMAYITIEDDTGAMENIAFSNTLSEYTSLLKENMPVIMTGRLSIREEKDPQIVIQSVKLIDKTQPAEEVRSSSSDETPADINRSVSKLYLRLPGANSLHAAKARAIINMFPGRTQVIFYFADSGRRAAFTCEPQACMLNELRRLLGTDNVVEKY